LVVEGFVLPTLKRQGKKKKVRKGKTVQSRWHKGTMTAGEERGPTGKKL